VKNLPDGLAIFLSGTANLKRMQPAIFVSAIRARHLIVIIFSLGRSLRFAQNNRGFVEKLSQPLPKMVSRQKFCHPREHRSGALCGAQAIKPVFRRGSAAVTGGRHRSPQILCRLVTMLFNKADKFTGARTFGGHGMRIKSVERTHEH
jgi:hypothetical protein